MSRTERTLDGVVETGITAVLLLSPLPFGSVLPWAQAALELLVVMTAALWIGRMLAVGSVAVRVTPVLWAALAMVPLFAIQLLVQGWTTSPYGTWESFRLYVAYLVFLLLLTAHLVTAQRIVRLVTILVSWGVILAGWALVNRALGRDVLLWFDNVAFQGRLVSTLVNANHQALYFGILLFLALGMTLRPARRSWGSAPATGTVVDGIRGTGLMARVLFAGGAALLGFAIVLTQSRAGVLSVAIGLLVVMALALSGRRGSAVAMTLAAGAAGFVGYATWVGVDGLLERFAVLAREPAADARWMVWPSALRLVRDAPVTGVGLGAFEDAIPAYLPPGVTDRWVIDYAHNDYLQLLAEGGIVALTLLVLGAGSWLWFVVTRWRTRRDPFVRGLVLGGLGAATAVGVHSAADFGLHMPANALLLVTVVAVVAATVTLRLHRTGARVDLTEWRATPGPRLRVVGGLGTLLLVTAAGLALVPVAAADWAYRQAVRLAGDTRRARAEATTADLSRAETLLGRAVRLEPSDPRIHAALAGVADELTWRTWSFGLTRDGVVLRPGTPRDRLAASEGLRGLASLAYERSLELRPAAARVHDGYGWFLVRLDAMRQATRGQDGSSIVGPAVRADLSADQSPLPRALSELREATRLDPASPALRRSLAMFVLMHRREIADADGVVARELQQAVRLDPGALREVVALLLAGRAEDLIWRAVPRTAPALVELAQVLEEARRPSAASAALEDAVAIASGPAEQVMAYLARARFALRRGEPGQALRYARHALVMAPSDARAFAVLGEAYEAVGQLDQAQTAWGSAVAVAGSDAAGLNEHRNRLAAVVARRGDMAGALAIRRQIVQAAPNDPGARLELARLLEQQGSIADALREYETARVLGSAEGHVQHAVAQAFARHGLLREAVAAAERGVRLKTSDDELRVELADLYARIGLHDRAGEQYRAVLGRTPGHEAASRGLRAVGTVTN